MLSQIGLSLCTENNAESLSNDISKLLRNVYNVIIKGKNSYNAYEIFLQYAGKFPKNVFSSCKAYLMNYAYQTKNWDIVDNILNTFFIRINSRDYNDFVDFYMMNFYKGLYFLAKEV